MKIDLKKIKQSDKLNIIDNRKYQNLILRSQEFGEKCKFFTKYANEIFVREEGGKDYDLENLIKIHSTYGFYNEETLLKLFGINDCNDDEFINKISTFENVENNYLKEKSSKSIKDAEKKSSMSNFYKLKELKVKNSKKENILNIIKSNLKSNNDREVSKHKKESSFLSLNPMTGREIFNFFNKNKINISNQIENKLELESNHKKNSISSFSEGHIFSNGNSFDFNNKTNKRSTICSEIKLNSESEKKIEDIKTVSPYDKPKDNFRQKSKSIFKTSCLNKRLILITENFKKKNIVIDNKDKDKKINMNNININNNNSNESYNVIEESDEDSLKSNSSSSKKIKIQNISHIDNSILKRKEKVLERNNKTESEYLSPNKKMSRKSLKNIFNELEKLEMTKRLYEKTNKQYKTGGKKYDFVLIRDKSAFKEIHSLSDFKNKNSDEYFSNLIIKKNTSTSSLNSNNDNILDNNRRKGFIIPNINIDNIRRDHLNTVNNLNRIITKENIPSIKSLCIKESTFGNNIKFEKEIENYTERINDIKKKNISYINILENESLILNKKQLKIKDMIKDDKMKMSKDFNILLPDEIKIITEKNILPKDIMENIEKRRKKIYGNLTEEKLMNSIINKLKRPLFIKKREIDKNLQTISYFKGKYDFKNEIKPLKTNENILYLNVPSTFKYYNKSDKVVEEYINKIKSESLNPSRKGLFNKEYVKRKESMINNITNIKSINKSSSYKNNLNKNKKIKDIFHKSFDFILDENKIINYNILHYKNTNDSDFKYTFNPKKYYKIKDKVEWVPVKKEYKLVNN